MSRLRLRTSVRLAGALAGAIGLVVLAPATASATSADVSAGLREAAAPAATLEPADRVALPNGGVIMRFDQERGGVPVHGGEAVVLDLAGPGAQLVGDATEPGIEAPGEPSIPAAAAIRVAAKAVETTALAARPRADLAIDPAGDGVLVWRVSVPSERPLGDFEALVDATTGEVLEVRDLTWRATTTGQAKLFLPNAVVENDGYGVYADGVLPAGMHPDIADRHDRDSEALTSLRTPDILENLGEGKPCLKGLYAHARVGRKERPVCRPGRDWRGYTREANRFEALMAYHHIDRTHDYLLDIGAPGINDDRQRVVANGFGADQSFYMPSSDEIRLGTGGVDDGEDGDVIVHEYGHALQDTQRPGFGTSNQAGAIGEGFGDYLAAAVSHAVWDTPDTGTPEATEWSVCVAEWDAVSYEGTGNEDEFPGICLRRTDSTNTWDEQKDFCDQTGQGPSEIHCIGEVWASALWELRTELGTLSGASVMDQVVLASQPMYLKGESFAGAAQKLMLADQALFGPQEHCTEIRAEMVERGFLPDDTPAC